MNFFTFLVASLFCPCYLEYGLRERLTKKMYTYQYSNFIAVNDYLSIAIHNSDDINK